MSRKPKTMRKREKEQYTYEAVVREIERLERYLANMLVDNSFALKGLELNTVEIQQKIGKLKVLREVLFV